MSKTQIEENPQQDTDDGLLSSTSQATEINFAESSAHEIFGHITSDWVWFMSPMKEVYAGHDLTGRYEIYPFNSEDVKNHLKLTYFEIKGHYASGKSINDFLGYKNAYTKSNGLMNEIYIRTASINETIYVDLNDGDGNVVEINELGWKIRRNPSIPFIRTKTMLPMLKPESGGTLEELKEFIHVRDEGDFQLLIAFIIECLREHTEKPVLYLTGSHGSGKTSLTRLLMKLIDPRIDEELDLPNVVRNLMVIARNNWLLNFGNLSKISEEISNALCRLSTGGASKVRSLFTNTDETAICVRRPIILNGIDEFIHKQDLLDRSLFIQTQSFEDNERLSETDFWAKFELVLPRIQGALFDAISMVLKQINGVEPYFESRMMDFIKLGCTLEVGLGWEKGSFQKAFNANRQQAIASSLEDNSVVIALRKLMEERDEWDGQVLGLINDLQPSLSGVSNYPKTPKGMSEELRRVANSLKETGLKIQFPDRPTYCELTKKTIRKIKIIKTD